MSADLEARLTHLQSRGVVIVDPRQTYLDEHVALDRISPGVVLYPGTRLLGARTFLSAGARVGTEGPAVLDEAVLGERAEVASGYVKRSVLLRDAKAGANVHMRIGTLLEEEASVAHAVGLKHTILMSFVTMGSLINFCDALVAGGTSRQDHSEVGSGFIHFNYTPWGRGDKATPSLVGDVASGALLRQQRIFLGGLSGMAGPQKVGYGSFTVAGQVIRREIPPNRIVSEAPRAIDKEFRGDAPGDPRRKLLLNAKYIGQLAALRAWYRFVRLGRVPESNEHDALRIVYKETVDLLTICIEERVGKLQEFCEARDIRSRPIAFGVPPCPITAIASHPYIDHVNWVGTLSESDVAQGTGWLQAIVDRVAASSMAACEPL